MLETFEFAGQTWYKFDLTNDQQRELNKVLSETSFKIDEINKALDVIFTGPVYEPSAFDFYTKLVDEKYILVTVFYSLVKKAIEYAQLEHLPGHVFEYDRVLNAFANYISSKDKE
jgi:hypothetical protein